LKTSIEKIRRQDLVRAAYQTFLKYGLGGMTVARIGDRAGMSHGIVNYYFKNKDQLLSVVVRHANCLIMQEVILCLKQAHSPRERLAAVIQGNFPAKLFNRETANAWASFYSAVPGKPEFERLQTAVYRRLHSNVFHELKQLADPDTPRRSPAESVSGSMVSGFVVRWRVTGSTQLKPVAPSTHTSILVLRWPNQRPEVRWASARRAGPSRVADRCCPCR
jgi:TetR/AcrR family transcriptional repressor of bet genes